VGLETEPHLTLSQPHLHPSPRHPHIHGQQNLYNEMHIKQKEMPLEKVAWEWDRLMSTSGTVAFSRQQRYHHSQISPSPSEPLARYPNAKLPYKVDNCPPSLSNSSQTSNITPRCLNSQNPATGVHSSTSPSSKKIGLLYSLFLDLKSFLLHLMYSQHITRELLLFKSLLKHSEIGEC
jgi:hypothetical protein